MISLSADPFACPVIPKFREFETLIIRPNTSVIDGTIDFVSTLQAIEEIRPHEPVIIPQSAEFFSFTEVSEYEKSFTFGNHPSYKVIRNFIVAIFRIFSKKYLPFTLCRRNVKAPAYLTYSIWDFLNKVGLINYGIDPATSPRQDDPIDNRWPQLVYTIDDMIVTMQQYEKKISPKPNLPVPTQHSKSFKMLTAIHESADRPGAGANIPGLLDFDGWTQTEVKKLVDTTKGEHPSQWKQSWENLSLQIGSKSPVECASFAAQAPFSDPTLEHAVMNAGNDLPPPEVLFSKAALSNNPNMRVVVRAVENAGKKARPALLGQPVETPTTPEEAASILALQKIAKNMEMAEEMHKKQILECLSTTVNVLKQSISLKRTAIEESKVQPSSIVTESELSTDERTWQSETEE